MQIEINAINNTLDFIKPTLSISTKDGQYCVTSSLFVLKREQTKINKHKYINENILEKIMEYELMGKKDDAKVNNFFCFWGE